MLSGKTRDRSKLFFFLLMKHLERRFRLVSRRKSIICFKLAASSPAHLAAGSSAPPFSKYTALKTPTTTIVLTAAADTQ